jgi:hypothetical protein
LRVLAIGCESRSFFIRFLTDLYRYNVDIDPSLNGSVFFGLVELKNGTSLSSVAAQANWENYKSFLKSVVTIQYF